ncbi:sodium/glutamate symporter, partial [Aeromonas salmonicida]
GGLVVALLLLLLRTFGNIELKFDTQLQTPLMLGFFASIGLSADLASLRRGGRAVTVFLIVVAGLLVVQNTLGVGLAALLGLDPHMGLLAGSITLSGGHGTGAAWGGIFSEKYGVQSASELAIACATFGLVLGGLIGGPVARHLVKKVQVPGEEHNQDDVPQAFEMPDLERQITTFSVIETLALLAISLKGGELLASLLKGSMLELPVFVCV